MLQTNFRRIVIARNMLEEELKFRVSVVDEDYEDGDNIFAPKKANFNEPYFPKFFEFIDAVNVNAQFKMCLLRLTKSAIRCFRDFAAAIFGQLERRPIPRSHDICYHGSMKILILQRKIPPLGK